jgi:hypothetical protein
MYGGFQKATITMTPGFAVQILIDPRVLTWRPFDFGPRRYSGLNSYAIYRRCKRSKCSFFDEDATDSDNLAHPLSLTTLT